MMRITVKPEDVGAGDVVAGFGPVALVRAGPDGGAVVWDHVGTKLRLEPGESVQLTRRPLSTSQPETGTGTPATAAAGSERGGFEGLAARTYTARREAAHAPSESATAQCAPIAARDDDPTAWAGLVAATYRKRAADRAARQEQAAEDAFRLATERPAG